MLCQVDLDASVLDAARERIGRIFDVFPKILVSFSGGKDSSVLLHLVMETAIARRRRVGVVFFDWEAQYRQTIHFVRAMLDHYVEFVDEHWVSLPMKTTNACSQIEPEWICWERGKKWVRSPPPGAITEKRAPPFYRYAMTFEELVPAFSEWYAAGELTACLVGVRCSESLNRWRALFGDKSMYADWRWTTWKGGGIYNAYPLYDWRVEDVWTYLGRSGQPYNPVYDVMHQAGLSLSQMRICEPYGDEQRRGLWLYHLIEPETWGAVCARVAGANTAALYGRERGNVMGNFTVTLPEGHSWQTFAVFLLDTMPPATAEHYRNKIATWMQWYRARGFAIADCSDGDTGAGDAPSWRRVVKMLLRNDFWAKTLSFSPTKSAAYERYKKIMERRRREWQLPI